MTSYSYHTDQSFLDRVSPAKVTECKDCGYDETGKVFWSEEFKVYLCNECSNKREKIKDMETE